jgi:uncharacterized protein (TIGR03435 family)
LVKSGAFVGKSRPPQCTGTREMRNGVRIQRDAGPMRALLDRHARLYLRMPVLDHTGLKGDYEWEVAIIPPRDGSVATVLEAFEDQLGLKLQRTTGPWQVLVVDDVRMPTPN